MQVTLGQVTRGSFLRRSEKDLSAIASLTKSVLPVQAPRAGANFVFASVTPDRPAPPGNNRKNKQLVSACCISLLLNRQQIAGSFVDCLPDYFPSIVDQLVELFLTASLLPMNYFQFLPYFNHYYYCNYYWNWPGLFDLILFVCLFVCFFPCGYRALGC